MNNEAKLVTIEDASRGDMVRIVALNDNSFRRVLSDIITGEIDIHKMRECKTPEYVQTRRELRAKLDGENNTVWLMTELHALIELHIEDLYIYVDDVEVW